MLLAASGTKFTIHSKIIVRKIMTLVKSKMGNRLSVMGK